MNQEKYDGYFLSRVTFHVWTMETAEPTGIVCSISLGLSMRFEIALVSVARSEAAMFARTSMNMV